VTTYVPAWPTLSPALPFRRAASGPPFPWTAPRAEYGFIARNLIYRLLDALGVGPGDVVLAPEYHHGNEIRAIRATGAAVRFFPIGIDLKPDLAVIDEMLRTRPKAILVIHYLGFPQPIEAIARACRRYGVVVIEDCALALLSEPHGVPLGSVGDYAVFCLYKTLPVPDGAMLVAGDPLRAPLPDPARRAPGLATLAGRTLELLAERVRSRAPRLGERLFAWKRAAGRALRARGVRGVPVGDAGFDRASTDLAASRLARALALRCDFAAIRERRRRNFAALAERLKGRAHLLDLPLASGVCPLFFPLIVPDKPAASAFLRGRGVAAIELWNEGADGAAAVESPACAFLRRHVLEVPIHQDLSEEQVRHVADQVIALYAAAPRPLEAGVTS
jgi:dTDP-4-amino-4,6-dideoxygalactose transaminase